MLGILPIPMLAALWHYGRRAVWAIAGAGATTALATLYFLATHSLGKPDLQDPEQTLLSVRDGVKACCAPEVFANNVSRMRVSC